MAGANIERLRHYFWPDAVERIKMCEFHFEDCWNKHARHLQAVDRSQFNELCNELLNAASLPAHDKAKENLDEYQSAIFFRLFFECFSSCQMKLGLQGQLLRDGLVAISERFNQLLVNLTSFEQRPLSSHQPRYFASGQNPKMKN